MSREKKANEMRAKEKILMQRLGFRVSGFRFFISKEEEDYEFSLKAMAGIYRQGGGTSCERGSLKARQANTPA